MSIILDHQQLKRPALPREIEKLFAAADVSLPARGPIPLPEVDAALAGQTIEKRLLVKCQLRELGYLA